MRRFWRRLRASSHWDTVVQFWLATLVLVVIAVMDLLNPNPAVVRQDWAAVGLFLLLGNVVVMGLSYWDSKGR